MSCFSRMKPILHEIVGIFGNFKYYEIAQIGSVELQRLDELYANTNEIGIVARMFVDGIPSIENAFARMVCDVCS